MKIALITNSRIPSLTANSIQALKVAQALIQLGYEIKMIAPVETEAATKDELRAHYGLRLVPDIEWIPSIRRLKRLDFILRAQHESKRFGADLIYTWLPQSAAWASRLGYPVVLEMHADNSGRLGAWWMRQFWKSDGRKLMTVTVSTLEKALQRSTRFKFPQEALLIAPNGVELERYANLPAPSEARRHLNLKENQTVGFTGHIYPGRGAELLFELAKRMPAVNFLWVGGSPELVKLWRKKLDEAHLTNVALTGFVKHDIVPLYQAAADILLMPYSRSISASSGQDIAEVINPMKMFEYMASGRAIISANLPSIREILNEDNAVFCKAGNEPQALEDWQSAIETLLADESRRLALGAQAQKDVRQWTWLKREERIMRKILSNAEDAKP